MKPNVAGLIVTGLVALAKNQACCGFSESRVPPTRTGMHYSQISLGMPLPWLKIWYKENWKCLSPVHNFSYGSSGQGRYLPRTSTNQLQAFHLKSVCRNVNRNCGWQEEEEKILRETVLPFLGMQSKMKWKMQKAQIWHSINRLSNLQALCEDGGHVQIAQQAAVCSPWFVLTTVCRMLINSEYLMNWVD